MPPGGTLPVREPGDTFSVSPGREKDDAEANNGNAGEERRDKVLEAVSLLSPSVQLYAAVSDWLFLFTFGSYADPRSTLFTSKRNRLVIFG